MNKVTLGGIRLRSVCLDRVSNTALNFIKHHLHYLLSGGKHYITADGEYYQCKEIN